MSLRDVKCLALMRERVVMRRRPASSSRVLQGQTKPGPATRNDDSKSRLPVDKFENPSAKAEVFIVGEKGRSILRRCDLQNGSLQLSSLVPNSS